jgi:hypothetical protein
MTWYSTHNNDRWVAEVLDYKTNGFFVEIGACSGTRLSSCYYLESQLNWSGPAVEPNSNYWKECSISRKHPVNACVYNFDGKIEYTECVGRIEERNWASEGISGITKHLRSHFFDYYKKYGTVVYKTAITPNTLLKNHNAPEQIDYVSIDTEGSELEILKAWPWNDYAVTLISVEGDGDILDNITDFLQTKKYTKVVNPYCAEHYEHHYCNNNFLKKYKFKIYE